MSRLMKIRNDPRVVPDYRRYRLMAYDFHKVQKKSFPTRIQTTGKTAPPKDSNGKNNNKSGKRNAKDRLAKTGRRRIEKTQPSAVNRRKKDKDRNVRDRTQAVRNNGRAPKGRNTRGHPSKGKCTRTGNGKGRRTTKQEDKKSRGGKVKINPRVKKTRTDERRGRASKGRPIRCSKCHRIY